MIICFDLIHKKRERASTMVQPVTCTMGKELPTGSRHYPRVRGVDCSHTRTHRALGLAQAWPEAVHCSWPSMLSTASTAIGSSRCGGRQAAGTLPGAGSWTMAIMLPCQMEGSIWKQGTGTGMRQGRKGSVGPTTRISRDWGQVGEWGPLAS